MQIPSDLKYVRSLSVKVIGALAPLALDESTILDIKLAIEEAVTNAILHGNRSCQDLPVTITFSVNKKRLQISVADKGDGFDYRNLPKPTQDENLTKTQGRGLFLIHHVMDKVHFNDKGNRIRMVKYL